MTDQMYPGLRNAISVYFANDSPYGYVEGVSLFEKDIETEALKMSLKKELRELFADETVDWNDVLNGGYHEVDDEATEEEARQFFIDEFWVRLFPGEPLPP